MTSTAYRNNFANIFGTVGLTAETEQDSQPAAVETVEAPAAQQKPTRRRRQRKLTEQAETAAPAASQPAAVPQPIAAAAAVQQSAATLADVADMAERYERFKAEASALYADADRLMVAIHDAVGLGNSVVLPDGRTLKVQDNFRDSQGNPRIVAFRPCGVKLYDLKIK